MKNGDELYSDDDDNDDNIYTDESDGEDFL